MKLQSQSSRKYKGKEYRKFWIVLPNKIIEKLGWKTGAELEAETEDNHLVVKLD